MASLDESNESNETSEQLLNQQLLYDNVDNPEKVIQLIPITDDDDEWINIDRYETIKKIGKDVTMLKSIFDDLNELVERQQEPLDKIEVNIASTKDNCLKGEGELIQAEIYQKSYTKILSYFAVATGVVTVSLISILHKK